jgi:hypothetical protein
VSAANLAALVAKGAARGSGGEDDVANGGLDEGDVAGALRADSAGDLIGRPEPTDGERVRSDL